MIPPDPSTLTAMFQCISEASEIYKFSAFWEELAHQNIEQLERRGYENFKQTVNQNYFNWLPNNWGDNQFHNVRRFWRKRKTIHPFLLRFARPMQLEAFAQTNMMSTFKERLFYRLFVGMLWEYARHSGPDKFLNRMEEPSLGNPLEILRYGRRISQDLANSILERNLIMRYWDSKNGNTPLTIGELGAGYGRLAYAFLKTTACRYLIFDIPPALHLSQWYLSNLFPDRRIFQFRRFADYGEIAEELSQADIAFFTPNQMEMFPESSVDIFATISSLHEMRKDQIKWYLNMLEKLSSRLLFIKQWMHTVNQADKITVTREDYTLSKGWAIIVDEPDAIQDLFFNMVAKPIKAV